MENSDVFMNPTGGETDGRGAREPALEPNRMERILASENRHRAWQQVQSHQGAPGIDGMVLEDFAANARLHWAEIRPSLRDGKYQLTPVRRVMIPKPGGKGERLLGVPTVLDRVVQQAIL